ncbi:MAG TPA: hypothetical protein VJY62_02155, partial [Bacteroidia bacterium]|nr:hypothetical protein [Bacteroidia bacterium]
ADARIKFIADSIAKAQAEEKIKLAAMEKARQDSIAKAKTEADARAKFVADSIAKAQAEQKARFAALEKARQDSVAKANTEALARAKLIADSTKRANEDARIAAQKEALSKTNTQVKKEQPEKIALPTLDKDYPEGISEETLKEANRTIYRTVIKKSADQDVFLKIVYSYATYYFKNGTSLSEANYQTELKVVKAKLNDK